MQTTERFDGLVEHELGGEDAELGSRHLSTDGAAADRHEPRALTARDVEGEQRRQPLGAGLDGSHDVADRPDACDPLVVDVERVVDGDVDGVVHVKRAIAVPHERREDVPVSAQELEAALRSEPARAEYGSILVPIYGTPLDDDIVQTAGRLSALEDPDQPWHVHVVGQHRLVPHGPGLRQ